MKSSALEGIRAALRQDRPVYGLWVTLESPSITEMAVALGLDWVVIDAEHGHLDWNDILGHVRATVRSRTVCLVRVAALDAGLIKRALDIGADGVVVPWMESAEQVRAAVAAASYPPAGRRGIGAERATMWGRCIAEHVAEAPGLLVVPLVESVRGGEQAAAMALVDGVELFFIGPADWSATAGSPGGWADGAVAGQIARACRAIRAGGKQVGVLATSEEDLRARREQGFRMLGLGIDGALLLRGIEGMLPATGSLRALTTAIEPCAVGTAARPLAAVPPALRPERRERLILAEAAPRLAIDEGVEITALVGAACGARGLCAVLARFAPGGALSAHRHPRAETVVVISGSITTQMDGRIHRLGPGDSIVIPAGTAHRTGNADLVQEALIHVAMPSDAIARTLEDAATWTLGTPSQIDVQGLVRSTLQNTLHSTPHRTASSEQLHAGPESGSGVRCRSLRLASGAAGLPCVHDVDAAVVVLTGSVRCRTAGSVAVITAGNAMHLPRGVAHELAALGGQDATLIETCADGRPLDAIVDAACLMPLPAAAPASASAPAQPPASAADARSAAAASSPGH